MFDLRLITGPASLVIGILFLTAALRLWFVHPVNRVFRLGHFVTERGLRALLEMRQVFLALGSFFTTQGVASITFWGWAAGNVEHLPTRLLGSLAAGFAIWAAGATMTLAYRVWHLK